MNQYHACSREIEFDCSFCPSCGAALEPPKLPLTVTSPPSPFGQAAQPDGTGSSSDTIDQARFSSRGARVLFFH
jgi:hypothetical protein